MLINRTYKIYSKRNKAITFENMMQEVIFHSTILHQGIHRLKKMVLFSRISIAQLLKAIAFVDNEIADSKVVIENQHFNFQNVGFLFIYPIKSLNQL